jgi:hypothetical protein
MTLIDERRLLDPSFGHVIALFVCGKCNADVAIAHARQFSDGTRHLLIPDRSEYTRGLFLDRKHRSGQRAPKMFASFEIVNGMIQHTFFDAATGGLKTVEISDNPETHLYCRKHGARVLSTRALLAAVAKGKTTRRIVPVPV